MAHDVFVCHPSDDRATANAVVATLEADRVRCWIAPRDVLPSEEWAESIVRAIAGTKLLILVFSGHSNESRHVMREVEQAVGRGIPILPFRIEDVEPSPALEYYIGGTHWLDALTPPLEAHLTKLVETVRILLPHERESPAAGSQKTSSAEIDVDDSPMPVTLVSPNETPPEPVGSEPEAEPRPSTKPPEPERQRDPIVETHHRKLADATPDVRPSRSVEAGDADDAAASLVVSSAISLLDTNADSLDTVGAEAAYDSSTVDPATDQPPPVITPLRKPPPKGSLLLEAPRSVSYDGTTHETPELPSVRRIGPIAISIDEQTLRLASAAVAVILVAVVGFLGIRGLISDGDTQVLGAIATTVPGGDLTNDGLAPLIPLSTSTSTTIPSTTAPAKRTTSTTSTSTTAPTTTTTTVPSTTSTTVALTTTTRRTTTTTTAPVVVLVARNDSYTRADRSQVCFDVTANDAGSGALTVTSVGGSEFGSATTASCGVLYTPPDVIARTDAFIDVFSYTVKDATGATASATVTVSVR